MPEVSERVCPDEARKGTYPTLSGAAVLIFFPCLKTFQLCLSGKAVREQTYCKDKFQSEGQSHRAGRPFLKEEEEVEVGKLQEGIYGISYNCIFSFLESHMGGSWISSPFQDGEWGKHHGAPLSMRFSRQEYPSGLPFPFPGDLPDPGVKPGSPALQAEPLPSKPPGKPHLEGEGNVNWFIGNPLLMGGLGGLFATCPGTQQSSVNFCPRLGLSGLCAPKKPLSPDHQLWSSMQSIRQS